MNISRKKVFGFDFISAASVSEIAGDIVDETLRSEKPEFLITPNAYQAVVLLDKDNEAFRNFYRNARYVLPDGMPIVWLSKLKGQPLQSRLTGSDLFPVVWQQIKDRQIPVTLVLPSAELADLFRKEYLLCDCIVPKFFDVTDKAYIQELAATVARSIINNNSRFVFIGLGIPKQELLGMETDRQLKEQRHQKGILFLLLGASFEFYFGIKKRAPALFRKTGMEWFYRFMQEPGRLWKRYTVDNVRFILLAIKEMVKPQK